MYNTFLLSAWHGHPSHSIDNETSQSAYMQHTTNPRNLASLWVCSSLLKTEGKMGEECHTGHYTLPPRSTTTDIGYNQLLWCYTKKGCPNSCCMDHHTYYKCERSQTCMLVQATAKLTEKRQLRPPLIWCGQQLRKRELYLSDPKEAIRIVEVNLRQLLTSLAHSFWEACVDTSDHMWGPAPLPHT